MSDHTDTDTGNETTDVARSVFNAYRRLSALEAPDLPTALTRLFTDLIHFAREIEQDPTDVIVSALFAAGPGDGKPWNAPEQRVYYSILVGPVDGITDRGRRDEITDMEVVVMRHDELMTRTAHRRVVRARRGATDIYHDHDHVPGGPLADAAFELWEETG